MANSNTVSASTTPATLVPTHRVPAHTSADEQGAFPGVRLYKDRPLLGCYEKDGVYHAVLDGVAYPVLKAKTGDSFRDSVFRGIALPGELGDRVRFFGSDEPQAIETWTDTAVRQAREIRPDLTREDLEQALRDAELLRLPYSRYSAEAGKWYLRLPDIEMRAEVVHDQDSDEYRIVAVEYRRSLMTPGVYFSLRNEGGPATGHRETVAFLTPEGRKDGFCPDKPDTWKPSQYAPRRWGGRVVTASGNPRQMSAVRPATQAETARVRMVIDTWGKR